VVSGLQAEAADIAVCWSQGAVRLEWYPGCRLKQPELLCFGVRVRFG